MSVKRSLAWMALAQIISFLVQFASTIVLARYLTPKEFGIAAVAFAVIAVIAVFQQLSLPALIVREETLTRDLTTTAFTVNAIVTVLLSTIIAVMSYAGASFLQEEAVKHAMLVLALSPLFGIVSFLPAAHLERDGRFRELALIGTFGGILTAVTSIAFAILGFSYMSVVYSQVVSSGGTALILMISGRNYASYVINLRAWRKTTTFSMQMLAVSGVANISQKMSEVMLGRILGLSALGMFNRSSGINNLLWNNIHLVVGRVILVDFAELHRKNVSLRERYLRTVAIVTAVLWPCFAGMAVVADPFVILVYGEQWLPAVRPFELIALSSMILVSVTMTWELFTATGRLMDQTKIESIRSAFGFAIFVGGCMISLEAAAGARIIDAAFAFLIYRPHLNRMTDTKTADYWPIYAESFLATGVAIFPAAVVMVLTGPHGPSLPILVASIFLGAACWFGCLMGLGHPVAEEIKATVGHRIRSRVS